VPTKHHAEWLSFLLSQLNIKTAAVYGDMHQTTRKLNIESFRSKGVTVLIVTDVAARGLDIPLLDNVVHYNFPATPKVFVHRTGRVARAGRSGTAYSLISIEEIPHMLDVYLFIGKKPANKINTTNNTTNTTNITNNTNEIIIDERYDYFGKIPQRILDAYVEIHRKCKETCFDLHQLESVAKRGMKKYKETKESPSPESVARAKLMLSEEQEMECHPMFFKSWNNEQHAANLFIEQLKNFRPPQTVLEMQSGDVGNKKKLMNVKK